MKNYLLKTGLFGSFFLFATIGFSQNVTQQWNIGVYDRNWMPPETILPFWTTHFYKTKKDTVINSLNYKQLFYSNDSLFNNSSYFGAFRTFEEKVLINKNENEYLLYDFSLKINDTTEIYRFMGDSAFVWKVKVNSISDTVINTRLLKKINVSYSDPLDIYFSDNDTDFLIEGIGSEKFGLLNEAIPSRITGPDKDFYLLCYKENDETVLQNMNYNNCYMETIFNSVYDKTDNEYKVYPSFLVSYIPLTIESQKAINQITIYDIRGTKVYNKKHAEMNVNLNLNKLKNGFYVISVNNKTFKLLINR